MHDHESTYLLSHHGAHIVEGHPVVAKGTVPYAKEGDVSDDSDDEATIAHDEKVRAHIFYINLTLWTHHIPLVSY